MENGLTKSAIYRAMEAAEAEGQTFTWRSLDRIFSAAVTGDGASIAERLEDDRTDREMPRERSPENVAMEDDRSEDEAIKPAWATASDGRRER